MKQEHQIGTLSEKNVHASLKKIIEPDESKHEIKVGKFHADILNESGIIEIQTRNFNLLRKKLDFYLEHEVVTIVHPMPRQKWLVWIDTQTGEISQKRKSPKLGSVQDAFVELYRIKQYLDHPNLRIQLFLIDMVEYRNLDGYSRDKKKGSTRNERSIEEIVDVICINSISDFQNMMPLGLGERFTSKDYGKLAKRNTRVTGFAINVLNYLGMIRAVGKEGRFILYEKNL